MPKCRYCYFAKIDHDISNNILTDILQQPREQVLYFYSTTATNTATKYSRSFSLYKNEVGQSVRSSLHTTVEQNVLLAPY